MKTHAEKIKSLIARGCYAGLEHGKDWTIKGDTITVHPTNQKPPSVFTINSWIERLGIEKNFIIIGASFVPPPAPGTVIYFGSDDPDYFGRGR